MMRFYWWSPAFMLSALLAGILLAIGHHIFYSQLNNQEVQQGDFYVGALSYSRQQANTQIGTALAFLTQVSLVAAVATAYAQLFWRSTTSSSPPKRTTLEELDIAYGVTSNLFLLFRPKVWMKIPVQFGLALIAWLLPIASIITPATLSVNLSVVSPVPSQQLYVPRPDFTSLAMAADIGATGSHNIGNDNKTDTYVYNGPSQAVMRVANSVTSGGLTLPIRAPAANSSWTMSFHAPALRCDAMNEDFRRNVSASIATRNFASELCRSPYGYLAWTRHSVPFSSVSGNYSLRTISPLSTAGNTSELFVAAMPGMWQTIETPSHTQSAACQGKGLSKATPEDPMGTFGTNSTLLQCRMYNSTYNLVFNYTNGEQSITAQVDDVNKTQPLSTIGEVYGPSTFNPANCSVLNTNNQDCFFDTAVARSISYQSIMNAFNSIVLGTVQRTTTPDNPMQQSVLSTRIVSSSLLDTPELAFLRDHTSSPGRYQFTSLQDNLSGVDRTVTANTTTGRATPLQQALEALFQNITISLMSSPDLITSRDTSSTEAASLTTVYLPVYRNVYVYDSLKLWLTYGLAISMAAICVSIAMFTVVRGGASYSSDFSTIFRTARHAHIEPDVMRQDADGRDPLPKRLKHAEVMLVPQQDNNEAYELHPVNEAKQPLVQASVMRSSPDNDSRRSAVSALTVPYD